MLRVWMGRGWQAVPSARGGGGRAGQQQGSNASSMPTRVRAGGGEQALAGHGVGVREAGYYDDMRCSLG